MSNVICATCKNEYLAVYSETQANDCASNYILEEKAVFCHYGSKHDTSKFNVINRSIEPGCICDNCIDTALTTNDIVLDSLYNFWESIDNLQKKQAQQNNPMDDYIIDNF